MYEWAAGQVPGQTMLLYLLLQKELYLPDRNQPHASTILSTKKVSYCQWEKQKPQMDLKRGMGQIVSGGTTQGGENVKTQARQVNVNCHYTATNMFNTPQYRAYMDPHFSISG